MNQLTCAYPTLGASCGLLRDVPAEVCHMSEVEVGSADGAVSVFCYCILCRAKKLGEGICFFYSFLRRKVISLIHVLSSVPSNLGYLSPASGSWAIVVVAGI